MDSADGTGYGLSWRPRCVWRRSTYSTTCLAGTTGERCWSMGRTISHLIVRPSGAAGSQYGTLAGRRKATQRSAQVRTTSRSSTPGTIVPRIIRAGSPPPMGHRRHPLPRPTSLHAAEAILVTSNQRRRDPRVARTGLNVSHSVGAISVSELIRSNRWDQRSAKRIKCDQAICVSVSPSARLITSVVEVLALFTTMT